MKPVWLWIIFLILYGLFSMKTQAAEGGPAFVEHGNSALPASQ